MSKRVAIGIDLGTTNSCVGVFRNQKVDIIENDMGHRTTPSQVAFDGSEVHVGEAAHAQAAVNPENTVREAKRLIGRSFTEVPVQDMRWPFEVFDDNGAPKIRVQCNEERKIFSPEQISALVLKRMKHFAERSTNVEIQDAVITVPAYFNDAQRQATIDAGKIAGLNVLSIINEPTAAALAYGFDAKTNRDQTVLIFDLGGGTFDVSIISIVNKNFTVKAVGGDTHLGGADFDLRLVNHFLELAKQKHNKDLTKKTKQVWHLREACVKAKILLSTPSGFKANVTVHGILDGEDFQETLSRSKFEQLCMDLFEKTIEHVKSVLIDAGMNKSDIDEVILVGGSSRIPKIQELLSQFFDGKKLNLTINPDEAVAYGAAVKAALDSGEHTFEEITLTDVVPLSLGMEGKGDVMVIFIKRNTEIPVTVVQSDWTTDRDDVTFMRVNVYEGERGQASSNNLLGTFDFDIGEKEKVGVPKVTFTFEVDANGILHVSGENKKTNCSTGITIIRNKGCLTQENIEKMMQEVSLY